MMNKSGAGILRFRMGIFLLGAGLAGWSTGARGQELLAVPPADESRAKAVLPATGELDDRIAAARGRIAQVDDRMAALEDEERTLMAQVRAGQREQFSVRQQILDGDKGLQELVQQIEALQVEQQALKESLAQRLAEQPDYAAHQARQTAAIERSGAIQRETMELANDRVRAQLELQALERQRATAGETAPEPAAAGTTLSAEDSDQL